MSVGTVFKTRAPSRTRSQKAAQLLRFLTDHTRVASLTSSATFGALHVALRLSVFA